MSFNYPENLKFACLKCGLCCGDTRRKKRHILLLGSEAGKISAFVGRRISEFTRRVEGKAPYVFEMRKSQKTGKCFFLGENTCTIYSERPIICRFYPFELRAGEKSKSVFRLTRECPGLGKGDLLLEDYFQKLFKLARNCTEFECI